MWAMYLSYYEALIKWQTNVGSLSAVLAQHHADSAQRLVFAIIKAVWCWPM